VPSHSDARGQEHIARCGQAYRIPHIHPQRLTESSCKGRLLYRSRRYSATQRLVSGIPPKGECWSPCSSHHRFVSPVSRLTRWIAPTAMALASPR
jgi:hypothetical protein